MPIGHSDPPRPRIRLEASSPLRQRTRHPGEIHPWVTREVRRSDQHRDQADERWGFRRPVGFRRLHSSLKPTWNSNDPAAAVKCTLGAAVFRAWGIRCRWHCGSGHYDWWWSFRWSTLDSHAQAWQILVFFICAAGCLHFLDDLSLSLVLDEFQVDRRSDGGGSVLFHVHVHFLVLFPRRHGRPSWTAVGCGGQRSF